MTIINGIEIDDIKYIDNNIKDSIKNNQPIDNILHVIIVISNPCQYARRYILAREFIYRMQQEQNIMLYVVELAYFKQSYHVTDFKNPNHLRLYTKTAPLWHKENMINIAVKKLLPISWKAMAWIDADIEFESSSWAIDTLKILNGSRDIVQLFSHCLDMDNNEDIMSVFSSFGFQYSKGRQYKKCNGNNFWHPGFAWAITNEGYQKIGGLFEHSILGSGDHNMALSLLGHGIKSINENVSLGYKNKIEEFNNNALELKLGYVPGVIRHYYHGSKKNRKYSERWQILVNHQYDPYTHVKKDKNGLLIPTKECPKELLDDILNYFTERKEDE